MNESKLIQIYKIGRDKGLLPNSQELNEFIYDELINECWNSSELLDLWYTIYGSYSKSGILEFKYQNRMSKNNFTWMEIKFLLEESTNTTTKKRYQKYLKNKRSKY